MRSPISRLTVLLWAALVGWLVSCATATSLEGEPKDVPILQHWHGHYPVAQLNRLPEGQRLSGVGYLNDAATFAAVWQAFKPGESVPEIDFNSNFLVFSRNVNFYNRTSIAKVVLKDGVAEVVAMETRSAMPIKEKVAMAVAVIPRAGVRAIQVGTEEIPVVDGAMAEGPIPSDPLQATYLIEGQEIRLVDGRSQVEAAPGLATKTKTSVLGKPVYGDLDDDSDMDAALLLVHDPGGSGTFYYLAVALNMNGAYRGTNGVLLGDRVAPQEVTIRNGVIMANYADRRPEEPMAASPSVGKTKYAIVRDGNLAVIRPLGVGEQVLEGWVTIGHEVRSFEPCPKEKDLWLLGDSPALKEIMAAYGRTLPEARPYTPLFMVLAGKYSEAPTDGFGVHYQGAFFATQLLRVSPRGNCRSDYIVVDSPMPGAVISSPLRVRGQARGNWFFEGDFPVVLVDGRGSVIGKRFCTAKGEWMTQDFVPFEGMLEFQQPTSGEKGILILKKDNPTGLPEHDDALEIPVFFK